MSGSADEIALDVLRAFDSRDYQALVRLLSKDCFVRLSSGRIYVGADGLSSWIAESAARYEDRHFELHSVSHLRDGFLLIKGTEHRTVVRTGEQAVPGAWLVHVEDERVTAVVYFRTEADAIRSLVPPDEPQGPVELVERVLDAFNRDDYVEMISRMGERHQFSSSLVDPGKPKEGVGRLAQLLAELERAYRGVVVESYELADLGGGFVLVEATVRTESETGFAKRAAVWLARTSDGLFSQFLHFEDAESARAAAQEAGEEACRGA